MKSILKFIRNIIIVAVLVVGLTTALDYFRISSGQLPIFNISTYDEGKKIQVFRGFIYQAKRKVTGSPSESLVDSKNISFKIFKYDLNVPKQYRNIDFQFTLETKDEVDCTNVSKLYYADKYIKVYTYCLDSIKVNSDNKKTELKDYLKKNNTIINDIDKGLYFTGLYTDRSTMMFENKDDDFTSQGLVMFRCNKTNINDIYFAPKGTDMKSDFCTYKDDDFKYISEVVDETPEDVLNKEKDNKDENLYEIIYEDDSKIYQFNIARSQYIYVVTPEVRGKKEEKRPLKEVIDNKLLTIDELIEKGLNVNIIDKNQEKE